MASATSTPGQTANRRETRNASASFAAAVMLVCAALIGLDLWRTQQARESDLAENNVVTINLARAPAAEVDGVLHSVEIVLTGLRGRIETEDL